MHPDGPATHPIICERVRGGMTDIHDRIQELEDRCFAAIAAGDNGLCESIAREAAEVDPDSWLILFACGCADMRDGHAADAIAQWMAAVDRMEDVTDIERMSRAAADVTAECMTGWQYPAHVEYAGLMAMSSGLSRLTGGSDGGFMESIMDALSRRVSETDQSANAMLMQSASEVAYTSVLFVTDLSSSVRTLSAMLAMSDRILDLMGTSGVPDEMDRMPIDNLRTHVGLRMEAYRQLVSEWDAAVSRYPEVDLSGLAGYWSGKGSKLGQMVESLLDAGLAYSRSGDERDLEAVRKAARMLVLKWLRIRK